MAGMFYSLKEAAERLGIESEQIKDLVEQGKLREFRDGANILFKITEVETLVGDESVKGYAKGADEEDIILEPSEGIDLQDSLGTEESLPMAEEQAADETAIGSEDDLSFTLDSSSKGAEEDLTSADTQVPDEGTNILGESDSGLKGLEDNLGETASLELSEAGTGAEALAGEPGGDDVNLDTFGSGSGLLDLSLQADDTSLGGILDEIYTPEQGAAAPAAMADASASAGIPTEAVAAEAEMIADVGLAAQQPAAIIQGYIEPEPDASSGWFGFMLFLPLIVVIYTTIVAISGLFDVMPTILKQTRGIILYILGGLLGFALILMILGFMSGGSKEPKVKKGKPPKAPKVKKEKKAKK